MMIPFILALTFSILLTLVFAIPGVIMGVRWNAMLVTEDSEIGVGDMKIPTFYASEPESPGLGETMTRLFCLPVVGGVFGGIHCVGWYFDFPSSAEARMWRVSSAVLTGVAFLSPILMIFVACLSQLIFIFSNTSRRQGQFSYAGFIIVVLFYVVSRLLLLVEAFISLRHLTPGMLALVTWTSFIPHI